MTTEISQSSVPTYGVRTRQQISKAPRSIQKPKRKYCHIAIDCKSQLIDLVLEKKLRIKDAAVICNLNYSTAKTILYNLRHKPLQQANYRQIKDNEAINFQVKIILRKQLSREYDFYEEINSII